MRSHSRTTSLLAAVALGASVALTGCGGEADTPPPAATGASAAAQPPDSCGGVGDLVKDHLKSAEVRSVAVNGQCTSVVVGTSLGDEDDATALRLCESAAEVAYTGDVNAVTVLAASGAELAIGISGAKCMA
ncbi:hypothetical protein [Catellatospora citrea]|uniref:Uncharacterized protein n=1 Tax=Catellatospora citrea TaxID=53366 RepID=A0A8J3NZH8_9ACTN|nr:hypothetical protein [Catellatospora citrea]RKE12433.1 hypothetical protein C8E86_7375 [Catellatospora citrea]GIF96335.1 hypothetical protein Cci01nite_14290 [Catellatospora citrea]